MSSPEFPEVCARTFTPYAWTSAYHWLLQQFPAHRGRLSEAETSRGPKIIIVGHSLGGWATLEVARKLDGKGIPVELTVQVASVGITDFTVPANVKRAANFYVKDLLGNISTKRIKVKDPQRTELLGNFEVSGAGHISITRDPAISELILNTVKALRAAPQNLQPRASSSANP